MHQCVEQYIYHTQNHSDNQTDQGIYFHFSNYSRHSTLPQCKVRLRGILFSIASVSRIATSTIRLMPFILLSDLNWQAFEMVDSRLRRRPPKRRDSCTSWIRSGECIRQLLFRGYFVEYHSAIPKHDLVIVSDHLVLKVVTTSVQGN